jgi:histidinol dehydrogenase
MILRLLIYLDGTAVLKTSGAQAQAAFSYGTKSFPKVGKLFGTGIKIVG